MKNTVWKRILSGALCVLMLLSLMPPASLQASAATEPEVNRVTDPYTAGDWMGRAYTTDPETGHTLLTTRYAGGVWTDKSVMTSVPSSGFEGISMGDPDHFLVSLSAFASNMNISGHTNVPTDTILVLDVSGSMDDNQRKYKMVRAANESLRTLLGANLSSRVGVVLYSRGYSVLLPLGRYTTTNRNGNYIELTNSDSVRLIDGVYIEGTTRRPDTTAKTVSGGTYTQQGIIAANNMFQAVEDITYTQPGWGTVKRIPILVLMSDGAASLANWDFTKPTGNEDIGTGSAGDYSEVDAAVSFATQLSLSYAKAQIEQKYNNNCLVYTLGLGISNDSAANGLMDPKNAAQVYDDWWEEYQDPTNTTVDLGTYYYGYGDLGEVTILPDLNMEREYVTGYFSADDTENSLSDQFHNIMTEISKQAAYFPTLVSRDENTDGYVSFVDRIGQYMEVKAISGVLVNGNLHTGASMAKTVADGSLGSVDDPTPLGDQLVWAVQARLGVASVQTARELIGAAYQHRQLYYTSDTDFSNYIGWCGDADGNFLNFYQPGVTDLHPDAQYTYKSYGYLGTVGEVDGMLAESDMMYMTVHVRTDVNTGEQMVAFAVPAALIPTATFDVTLDKDNKLTGLDLGGAQQPIRLVYEAGLQPGINAFTLSEMVDDAYEQGNSNGGGVAFYTNQYEVDNSTSYGTVNTYAYFNPSNQNTRYYYTEDTPVYSDTDGTLYTGTGQPTEGYRRYTLYKKDLTNGELITSDVYRAIAASTLEETLQNEDGWYVPAGCVYVNLEGYTVEKDENNTGTLGFSDQAFVDTNGQIQPSDGGNYVIGAVQGNNGRLIMTPATGIRLTKTVSGFTATPTEEFTFTVASVTDPTKNSVHPVSKVAADGTVTDSEKSFVNGKMTLTLKHGEIFYIGGMTAGEQYTVTETATEAYILESINGDADADALQVTVEAQKLAPADFVNIPRGTGDLSISKSVGHDLGNDYQIPAGLKFTMDVTLTGIGTAGKTFRGTHTSLGEVTVKTDANGKVTIGDEGAALTLEHDESLIIHDLPEGALATVVEMTPPAGFTANYWVNEVQTENATNVPIVAGDNANVIVVNLYSPREVYPVNLTVGGTKTLSGREWIEGDSFTFELRRINANGFEVVDTDTVEFADGDRDFAFDLTQLHFTEPGVYNFRIVEAGGTQGGITYDTTVQSFSVTVGDLDMDGQLEITDVSKVSDTVTVTHADNNYNVHTAFTNTYDTNNTVSVTVELQKRVNNPSGSARGSLSGFQFVLTPTGETSGETVTSPVTDAAGQTAITMSYTEPGTYTYALSEVVPGTLPTGWTYSDTTKNLYVVVTDDLNGNLSASIYDGVPDVALEESAEEQIAPQPEEGDVPPAEGEETDVPPAEDEGGEPAAQVLSLSYTFENTYDPGEASVSLQSFISKSLTGREMEAGEFSFQLLDVNRQVLQTATNKADGSIGFNDLTFTQVGIYYYSVEETSESGNGVTVDKHTHTFHVDVTDAGGTLNANYTVTSEAGQEIEFRNSYTTSPASYTVTGTKHLTGHSHPLTAGLFGFALTETTGGVSKELQRVYNQADGSFHFDPLSYSVPGTYTYTVHEIKPTEGAVYGVTYDTAVYSLTVEVTDNGMGQLIATPTLTGGDSIVFTNEYTATPTSSAVSGTKELTGKLLTDGRFTFELLRSDANWSEGEVLQTVTNSEDGSIAFDAVTYTTAGTYYYLVREVNGGETIDGVTYDSTVYRVRVSVIDYYNRPLEISTSYWTSGGTVQPGITFRNLYNITGEEDVTVEGNKTLTGRELQDGEFTFDLFEATVANDVWTAVGEVPAQSAKNDADGDFSFTLHYTAEDVGNTFYYILEENQASPKGGVTYDTTKYYLTVVVSDNDIGGIKTEMTVLAGEQSVQTVTFNNTYSASKVPVILSGSKTLTGRELKADEFSFQLFQTDGSFTVDEDAVPVQTVKNGADGKFRFAAVDLTADGEYCFVVRESAGSLGGVTYDGAEYRATVKVIDNLNGQLEIDSVTYTKVTEAGSSTATGIAFANTYNAESVKVALDGWKILENRPLSANEFSFELYEADAAFTEGDKLDAQSNAQNGEFKFELTYELDDADKTFYYIAREASQTKLAGVTYDAAEYHITVTVTDNGDGTLSAAKEIKKGETASAKLYFTNTYATKPVDLELAGTKVLEGRPLKDQEFTFQLFAADEQFAADEDSVITAKNDTDGSFAFDKISLEAAGTYYFVVSESTENALGGINYDDSVYQVTVVVSDDYTTAQLSIDSVTYTHVDGETAEAAEEIVFNNGYSTEDGVVTLRGTKTLTGRDLEAGEFTFMLYQTDEDFVYTGGPVKTTANLANGIFAFEDLTFSEAGVYRFVILEDTSADLERVTYDTTEYRVTILVVDDEAGKLVPAQITITDQDSREVNALNFTNVFTPKPADLPVTIDVTKTVVNKGSEKIGPEGFVFQLTNVEANRAVVAESNEKGAAKFDLVFTEEDIGKTFKYRLTESAGNKSNVTYSTAAYEITVAIALSDDNKLVATLTCNGEKVDKVNAQFENIYDYTPDVPDTGDHTGLFGHMTLLTLSLCGFLFLVAIKRKEKAAE